MSTSRKRSKTSTSGESSRQYDANIYVSLEASERAASDIIKRNIIPERGMVDNYRTIHDQVRQRKWQHLLEQPKAAVLDIVREFYANVTELHNGKVFVRGVRVDIREAAINQFFGLQSVDDSRYQELEHNCDYDQILTELVDGDIQWKRNSIGRPVNFPSGTMEQCLKAWLLFINAKFMPTMHHSDVTTSRARILYAIQQGWNIDVGKLVRAQILFTANHKKYALFFPCMITELCTKAGVKIKKEEELIQPRLFIGPKVIEKLKDGSDSDSDEEEEEAQPSAPIPRTVQGLHQRLDAMERRFDDMTENLDRMEGKCDLIMQAVQTLFSQLPPPPTQD